MKAKDLIDNGSEPNWLSYTEGSMGQTSRGSLGFLGRLGLDLHLLHN